MPAHAISKVICSSYVEMLTVLAEEIDGPRWRVFRQSRNFNGLHRNQDLELWMQGFDVPFEGLIHEKRTSL